MSTTYEGGAAPKAWTRGVDAASPAQGAGWPAHPSESTARAPALLSPLNQVLEPRPARRRCTPALRLTDRDCETVELVARCEALCARHVQTALFPDGATSRCQLRLQLLVRHGYLDRLPRKSVNEPAVYLLTRRSVAGNRLLRERWGEAEWRRSRTRQGPLGHLLAVNDVRVRVLRACRDLGWELVSWQRPEDLAARLRRWHLVPDAYFEIRRTVGGETRTMAGFLELERAGKSSRVLSGKLERYRDLCLSRDYPRLFGPRALRLLVVFAADSPGANARRVEAGVAEARRLGIPLVRFTGLDRLKAVEPAGCLTAPVWYGPGEEGPVALLRR